jgi:hypothetical protein
MNLIHFSVAIIIFLVLTAMVFKTYSNYLSVHTEAVTAVDAKINTFLAMQKILSKGFPENWDESSIKQLGLLDYMHRTPVEVTETSGEGRYTLFNITLTFDHDCSLIALNNTVRVYEYEEEVPFTLYNQTYCYGNYLKDSTIVINSSFLAWQSKIFYVYYSNDSNIIPANYSLPFSTDTGFNVTVYPRERMLWLSVDKLQKLRQLNYSIATASLSAGNEFYIEVSE